MTTAAKPDRRAQRTRTLLVRAFNELVLQRGYDALTVRDIIEHANVGRSTFYEHFENKDDILRRSLRPVFGVLADALGTAQPSTELAEILAHFRENARLVRALFRGSTHFLMSQILAELMEERLSALPATSLGRLQAVPVALVAAQLAGAQLGLIEAWVSSKAPCPCEQLARALHASANASLQALFG